MTPQDRTNRNTETMHPIMTALLTRPASSPKPRATQARATQARFDFNTRKGILAVADHLDSLALDTSIHDDTWQARHHVGMLRILPTFSGFTRAAAQLRENAGRWYGREYVCKAMETDVAKMDAVRHCGSPEAALATIRRQLDAQGENMEPADVRRCERAASLIEAHIEKAAADAAQAAMDEAEAKRIAKGTQPGWTDLLAPGTEVFVTHAYREFLATVSASKVGPHPILGKQHPVALYTVEVTHLRETRHGRYAMHPVKRKVLKKLIPKNLLTLPAP